MTDIGLRLAQALDQILNALGHLVTQDQHNLGLVLLPRTYKGFDAVRQVSLVRRIEDKLLKMKLNMDKEVGITFAMTDRHGDLTCEHVRAKGSFTVDLNFVMDID